MSAWVLPDHLADVLPSEARHIEELRRLALDGARRYGYELVMPPLLEHLESVPVAEDRNFEELRFPVQYVIRPNLDFRGFAGQLASGVIKPGDEGMSLPAGRITRVKELPSFDGPLAEAFPPMSITVVLEDEIDLSRGEIGRAHV